MFETQRQAAVEGITALGESLLDGLFSRLAEVNDPLQNESTEQAAKAGNLRESYDELKPRVSAKLRILATEIDQALAQGRDEDVEAKRLESERLTAKLQRILSDADACQARVEELAEQQRRNYRTVFELVYPTIREATVGVEIELCRMLDEAWNAMLKYESQSGLPQPFVRSEHRATLTPNESGSEAAYFNSLRRWFGGRR